MINVSENVDLGSASRLAGFLLFCRRWWLAAGRLAAHLSVMRRTCGVFSVEGGISAAESSHRSTCDSDESHQGGGGGVGG